MDQSAPLAALAPAVCPLLVLNEVGRVVSSNAAAQRLLGLSAEQLALKSCQLVASESAEDKPLGATKRNEDLILLRGEGDDGLVVKARGFRVDDGIPLTLVLLAGACPATSPHIHLSAHAIDDVARQLRTPLHSIEGYLDLLVEQQRPIRRAELEKIIGVLRRNSVLVEHLVGELVTALGASAGVSTLDLRPATVTDILEEAVGNVGILAEGKRQSITLVLPNRDAHVIVDRARVVQALSSALFTAIRNTCERSRLTLSATQLVGYWQISLSNDAMSVPWWQHDSSIRDNELVMQPDETDLGIAVAKAIVELHGGKIGLTSSSDSGNIFWFTLPIWEGAVQSSEPELAHLDGAPSHSEPD